MKKLIVNIVATTEREAFLALGKIVRKSEVDQVTNCDIVTRESSASLLLIDLPDCGEEDHL